MKIYFLCAIDLVINFWLGGKSIMSLAEFVSLAPLASLLKPDGEI